MTKGDEYLAQIARNVAFHVETKASGIHDDLSDAKIEATKGLISSLVGSSNPVARNNADEAVAKVGRLEVTKDFATSCAARAEEYVPKNGDDYVCPECWVKEAVKVSLMPVSEGMHKSSFLCPDCEISHTLE